MDDREAGAGPTAESRGPDERLERIFDEARSLGGDLLDLLRVGVDRVRSGAKSGAYRLVVLAWLSVATASATIVGVYFVVDGLAGLATWASGGNPWAGRLVAGLVILAAIGSGLGLRTAASRRSELKRLRAKYGEPA